MSEYELEKFEESLKNKIYSIRGFQVMLDRDLAELYGVETKRLNEAVKRNKERFPEEFCFQLKYSEVPELRSQFATSNTNNSFMLSTKVVKKGGRRFIPYVFTEQGVAMLAGVLKSDIAVKISIKIMKAFIEMRKFTLAHDPKKWFAFSKIEKSDMEVIGRLRDFE